MISSETTRADLLRHWPWFVAGLLAILPAVRMLLWVTNGSDVQSADYWHFFADNIEPDGSPRLRGLIEFQYQHVVSLPMVIYYANIRLFGGSNVTLGWFVVAIVAVQVALVWRLLADVRPFPTWVQAGLGLLVSVALFSPRGAWNFLLAMSGTAWLLANLLMLLVVWFATRDRYLPAIVLAVVATLTYGTGLMCWPVLALIVLVKRPPKLVIGSIALCGAVTIGTYVLVRAGADMANLPRPGPFRLLRNSSVLLGSMLTSDVNVAGILGGVVIAVTSLGVVAVMWKRRDDLLPFACIGAFGLLNALQIGYGRNDGYGGDAIYFQSRYVSVVALTWIGAAVLATAAAASLATRVGRPAMRYACVAPVLLLVPVLAIYGRHEVTNVTDKYDALEKLADAQRVKVSAGRRWFGLLPHPDTDDRLQALRHHPFDERYDRDCGLLGRQFSEPVEPVDTEVKATRPESLPEAVELAGVIPYLDSEVECVIALDANGRVVGVGGANDAEPFPGRSWATLFAPRGSAPVSIAYRVIEDGRWRSSTVTPPG